jgi:hypothetical protein
MTYGRTLDADRLRCLCDAAVSHSAELVRGELSRFAQGPPHPPLWGTFSPRGEGRVAFASEGATP